MKIVIDARESGTSTGRYIDKLVEQLAMLKPSEQVTVFTKTPRLGFMMKAAPDFTVVASDIEEFTFAEQIGFKHQLNNLRADLVHFGMTQQPVLYRGRTVTTVHDLTTARFENPDKNWLVFRCKQLVYRWVIKRVARKSAALITPSQFVKDDLVDFTGVNPDKVTVTYEAADRIEDAAEPLANLKGERFIMYVGRPTPHKNLERLIAAFEQLDQPDLYLVLAGKKDANYRRIEANVKVPNIVFTDFITDGQLRWLYENCQAYVFPSLSEGFGLPGLEAMAHGAPVVSSNATCLPEIYGAAAHYFDPFDVNAMAAAIGHVLADADLRAEMIKRGHAQVKKYSWKRTAKQTLAVYDKVLKN
jgi:glycosyltransferase involved in cell wall biosynthesis